MDENNQQIEYVNNQGGQGIALKTQQYGGQPSIAHSRALSKNSHTSNPQQLLSQFQSYTPLDQDFSRFLQKMHQSINLKLKKYKQSIYYGEMCNYKRNGKGIMVYNNDRVYEGQWLNDLKEGQGYEKFPNSSFYKGNYVSGKPSGIGKYQWTSGQFYQGQWESGMKHGSGMWRGVKGDSYIGEWKHGKADGYGVHTWVNGDRYQGQFKQCLKHGEGLQKFANGDIYKGRYQEGKPDGFGQYYWSNGSYFKGNFKRGVRNGIGIWKRAQGKSDKYEGQYLDDKKNGYGIFSWASGNVYKGNYLADQRDGYGQMYWTDGSFYKGDWRKGIQHGMGEIYVPNEGWKKGIFQNNVLVSIEDQDNQANGFDSRNDGKRFDKKSINLPDGINISRYRKESKYQKKQTPKSLNTVNTNERSRSKGLSNRQSQSKQFHIRNTKNPVTKQRKVLRSMQPKANGRRVDERTVIDLNNMRNQQILPSRFNRSSRDKKSVNDSTSKSNQRERILHSSFYLHKLHNRRTLNQNKYDYGMAYNPGQNQSHSRDLTSLRNIRTGDQARRKQQIVQEVRSFTKDKLKNLQYWPGNKNL